MKNTIRLTETELINVIKKIISEDESMMDSSPVNPNLGAILKCTRKQITGPGIFYVLEDKLMKNLGGLNRCQVSDAKGNAQLSVQSVTLGY